MKPLLKTEYCTVPLSIPRPWKEFLRELSQMLGTSQNAAMLISIRFGGPLLAKHVNLMRQSIKNECLRLDKLSKPSEILGAPPSLAVPDMVAGKWQTKNEPKKPKHPKALE